MKQLTRGALVALSLAAFSAVQAQNLMETFTWAAGSANTTFGSTSGGPTYSASFGTLTAAGGYSLGRITIEGNIRRNQSTTGDTPNDNRLALWRPGVVSGAATHRVDTTTTSWGSVTVGNTGAFSGILNVGTAFDPTGLWTGRLFNWFDDAPTATDDSWYEDLTIKFFDNNVTAPSAMNLGSFSNIGDFNSDTAAYAANGIKWYKFTTTQATASNFGIRLHTYTDNGVAAPQIADTEFGVFSSTGSLLYSNDDASAVSGSNFPINQGVRSFGQFGAGGAAGSLAAGTYYVAVGAFNTVFANGFGATSSSTATGNIRLSVQAVPEPATFLAIGVGMLLVSRRKRA